MKISKYNYRNIYFSLVLAILLNVLSSCTQNNNLINVSYVIPDINLDIRYATTNNFTGKKVYDTALCFLRKEVAEHLKKVQDELKTEGLSLKIFDGYRPLSVQKKFWELVPDERFVANPSKGSRHNRGAAVDVTLIDNFNKELEMPTEFDDFTEKAGRDYNDLNENQIINRKHLEDIMRKHGFIGLPTEWWHFDYKDWEKYDVLDINYRDINK
ncbi:MAG: M15 family metallopeptidase [Ignavibacteriae bacterium]|jgi:D-alanyl-D-alanine dipeptidase|nr:M15 family metallopeptidase [Ignavibacteriota bacterium]